MKHFNQSNFPWTFIYPLYPDELEHDDGGFQEARGDNRPEPAEDGREAERDDQDAGGEPGEGEGQGGAGGKGDRADEAERGEGGGVGEAKERDNGAGEILPRECSSASSGSNGGNFWTSRSEEGRVEIRGVGGLECHPVRWNNKHLNVPFSLLGTGAEI